MKTIRCLIAVLFATALILSASQTTSAADPKELTFAAIQTEEMAILAKAFEPTLKFVGNKVGKKFNFLMTTSYASVVEAMMGGFVHFAKLGPKSYIIAAKKSKGAIKPMVSTARPPHHFSPEPCGCYKALLITRAGTKFSTIESLKGAILAVSDPASTSGYAVPSALFTKVVGGTPLEKYFGKLIYTGAHTASAKGVKTGKVDAAFVADTGLSRMIDRGEVKKGDFNYLWTSPIIPIDVIAYNSKLISKELATKVSKAFQSMTETPEGRAALKASKFAAFPAVTDAVFDNLRAVLAEKARLKKLKKKKK